MMILVSSFLFYKEMASHGLTQAPSPPALKPFLVLSVPFRYFYKDLENFSLHS